MSSQSLVDARQPRVADGSPGLAPRWPAWVADLLADAPAKPIDGVSPEAPMVFFEAGEFRLVRAYVANAADLDPSAFEAVTATAYLSIARQLKVASPCHPARMWNYIPAIHRPSGTGIDRYMIFNRGRFQACQQWFEDHAANGNGRPNGRAGFESRLPTASGIGHGGPDLVIDALACKTPGVAIENPRQIPSYRYARRYGPKPPCFARATLLPGLPGQASRLFVGGTASILGEDSMHVDDLAAQIDETLRNLAAVAWAAEATPDIRTDQPIPAPDLAGLKRFQELRIYHPRAEDRTLISERISQAFPSTTRVEWLQAELCRKELLVEIEGVASCTAA